MTPETPEPPQPESEDTPASDPPGPRPPRILVSVGDLEAPADWDVIVVENDAIDDATALRIARQRTGHVGAASLDEHDVDQALFPHQDTEGEGAHAVTAEAFAPPEDLPVRTPARPDAPPPMPDDGFGHLPDADTAVEPEGDGMPVDATEPGEDGHLPAAPAHPFVASDEAAMADEPEGVFDPIDAEGDEPATEGEVEAPVLQRELLDDPGDDFYDIGDDEVEPVASAEGDDEVVAVQAVGIEGRELLDDPKDDFFDIGVPDPDELSPDRMNADLWGRGPDGELPARPADAATAAAAAAAARAASSTDDPHHDEVVPLEEEVAEDRTFDSAFPLGPDDLLQTEIDNDGATIGVDALDYANVFGPVAGTRANLPDVVPVRTRRIENERALGLYDDEDELEDGYDDLDDEGGDDGDGGGWVAAGAGGGGRGRRRALAALAMAGLVVAGIGVASQLFEGGDPELSTDTTLETTTSRVRRPSQSNTTTTTVGATTSSSALVEGGVTGTTRPRTTTTRPGTTTTRPPAATTTTTAATTTTTAATTTTTAATTTTTTTAPPP